jgi:Zn-dependent peptidase ImmA (M78 family)
MSKIHAYIEDILNKHNIKQPPIEVEEIAKKLNFFVIRRPYSSGNKLAAMLIRDAGKVIIALNGSNDKEKQRFSIAHEIGHYFLHPGENLVVDREFVVNFRDSKSSIGKHIQEIEANRFASNLLIPEHFLIDDLRSYLMEETIDNNKISRELSKKYIVSPQTMNIRINSLLDELKDTTHS